MKGLDALRHSLPVGGRDRGDGSGGYRPGPLAQDAAPGRARWIALAIAATLALGALLVLLWMSSDGARILAQRGVLVAADSTFLGVRGRSAHWEVWLRNDRGFRVRARLREPVPAPSRAQLVVLIDGQGIGADAVDLLPEDAGTIAVALDYPETFPQSLTLEEAVAHLGRIRRAALQVPASVLLALDAWATRPDVDTARIAVIGSSLGVPAATAATALDPRVDGTALVYGGGDLALLLETNLEVEPALLRAIVARLGALWIAPLEPTRYAGRIAPRPLVLINGSDDPRIPEASVRALYDAARPPKRVLWLPTGHLDPGDVELLRALADSAVSTLPILTRTP